MLNLDTVVWSSLATTGQHPGSRDSHSAVLVGQKMIIFGGTNGCKKVNDLHILDLRTNEWSRPVCDGNPPSPRESHTATIVGDDRLVVFGGSGEGEGNYLNDMHVLDLKKMKWITPEVKGDLPAPRDSHTAVAIENKLIVYGGDCGDRYHGEVDVLDMDTLTWSRLAIRGSSPGFRAGHATVNIGTKVFVIGGVGAKHYYNDVWLLDLHTCSWTQLDICGQQPHGRFSHSAVIADSDIAIYGGIIPPYVVLVAIPGPDKWGVGARRKSTIKKIPLQTNFKCGEDEHPLNELLILQLGPVHPNGRYNFSLCKIFGNHWNQTKKKYLRQTENKKNIIFSNGESNCSDCETDAEWKHPTFCNSDRVHTKRRKNCHPKSWEVELEQEEQSQSLSQHSSQSQSTQEQIMVSPLLGPFKQQNQTHNHKQSNTLKNQMEQSCVRRTELDFPFMTSESQRHPKTEQFLGVVRTGSQDAQYSQVDQKLLQQRIPASPILGADVRGTINGAFDSGYLMTANVNGQILRGVLFSPGPGIVTQAAMAPFNPSRTTPFAATRPVLNLIPDNDSPVRPLNPTTFVVPESGDPVRQAQPPNFIRATPSNAKQHTRLSKDLQGVVLTL